MKYQGMFRICPVCGKHRAGKTDHTACSKILQKRARQDRKSKKPAGMSKLLQDYHYHDKERDFRGNGESRLDTEALERFKNKGEG